MNKNKKNRKKVEIHKKVLLMLYKSPFYILHPQKSISQSLMYPNFLI